jgi:transcriptional regulator with XRE-family HTH domain
MVMDDEGRRAELADFLRTRRARLAPSQVGLSAGGRRRTSGLRHEEVAELAGVSITWYTWLEQGRPVAASAHTLEDIARALRLDPAERAHLFVLARPASAPPAAADAERAGPAQQRVLDALGATPAYIMGRRWDIRAWNRAMCAVFVDVDALPERERNMLRLVFTNPTMRARLVDWEGVAQRELALFRAESGRYAGDPWFEDLVDELRRVSPEFAHWWPRHDVRGRADQRMDVAHPDAGRLALEATAFGVRSVSTLTLVAHAALPEAETEHKLSRLTRCR